MMDVSAVTALIINRKTLDLTRTCLETLLCFYPRLRVVVVDNQSTGDPSRQWVHDISGIYPNVMPVMITAGVPHHAHGLNVGFSHINSAYVLTLDSDIRVLRGEWLELMLGTFADANVFAVGQLAAGANSDCTRPAGPGETAYSFIHPYCALWDKQKFDNLHTPFDYSGQPACSVCTMAQRQGWRLVNLEGLHPNNVSAVPLYVHHQWGGTRHRLMILEDEERKLGLKK